MPNINLASVSTTEEFRVDVNDDGNIVGLIVGASSADPDGRNNAGSSYAAYCGKSGFDDGPIDLAREPGASTATKAEQRASFFKFFQADSTQCTQGNSAEAGLQSGYN